MHRTTINKSTFSHALLVDSFFIQPEQSISHKQHHQGRHWETSFSSSASFTVLRPDNDDNEVRPRARAIASSQVFVDTSCVLVDEEQDDPTGCCHESMHEGGFVRVAISAAPPSFIAHRGKGASKQA